MKQVLTFALAALVGFTSCKKDEVKYPTASFSISYKAGQLTLDASNSTGNIVEYSYSIAPVKDVEYNGRLIPANLLVNSPAVAPKSGEYQPLISGSFAVQTIAFQPEFSAYYVRLVVNRQVEHYQVFIP